MALYKNPDFCELPPALWKIFNASATESFFSLPQWYDLMVRFGVPTGTDVRVYTGKWPAYPAAILLQVDHNKGCRSLASLTNSYSVEHGLLYAPFGDIEASIDHTLGEIWAERPRWDCLKLLELDPASPSFAVLLRLLRERGFLVECTPGSGTWFENTDQMTFADYFAQRPSQLRSTWRRKTRSIRAAGELSSAFFASSCGLDKAVADYQSVYDGSWKPPEAFPRFIPELIRLAAELGALRMGIYYLDGEPAAAQFWIIWKGRAIIYKLSHKRKFDKLSLGTLLTMEMIERVLVEDRPYEINLGRGDDPYKRLWLPKRRQRWGITVANPRTFPGLRLGLRREAVKLYHRIVGEPITPMTGPRRVLRLAEIAESSSVCRRKAITIASSSYSTVELGCLRRSAVQRRSCASAIWLRSSG